MPKTANFTSNKKLFASNEFANHNIVGSNGKKVVGIIIEAKGERFIVTLSILLVRRGRVGGIEPPLWQHLPARDFDNHWKSGIKLVDRGGDVIIGSPIVSNHRQSC